MLNLNKGNWYIWFEWYRCIFDLVWMIKFITFWCFMPLNRRPPLLYRRLHQTFFVSVQANVRLVREWECFGPGPLIVLNVSAHILAPLNLICTMMMHVDDLIYLAFNWSINSYSTFWICFPDGFVRTIHVSIILYFVEKNSPVIPSFHERRCFPRALSKLLFYYVSVCL